MAFQQRVNSDPLLSPEYMESINITNDNENENIDENINQEEFINENVKSFGYSSSNSSIIQSAGNKTDCLYSTPPDQPNEKSIFKKTNIYSSDEFGIDPKSKIKCCQMIDSIFNLKFSTHFEIQIVKTEKIIDFFGSAYIVYTIQTIRKDTNEVLFETQRRYSEFDMLQKHLTARFPTLIVPPIPGKSNLIEYATGSSKNQKDSKMVEKRKRMLQRFLNRLKNHPVFSNLHIIHLFIQTGSQWSSKQDINELAEATNKIVSCIDEPRLALIKDKLSLCLRHITAMYNINNETCKHIQELSIFYASSGEIYNRWSLEENGYSVILDHFRQTGESIYNRLQAILRDMDAYISDTLYEYIKYSEIALSVCKVYRGKFNKYQSITSQVENKHNYLRHIMNETPEQINSNEFSSTTTAATAAVANGSSGINLENNILRFKHTINSLIDNDPIVTRQNNIASTKEQIEQLEKDQENYLKSLAISSLQLKTDIERFEHERQLDFKKLIKQYAIIQRDYNAYQYELWSTIKSQVEFKLNKQ